MPHVLISEWPNQEWIRVSLNSEKVYEGPSVPVWLWKWLLEQAKVIVQAETIDDPTGRLRYK